MTSAGGLSRAQATVLPLWVAFEVLQGTSVCISILILAASMTGQHDNKSML